jgi:FkbM family methyltransferase
MINFLKICFGKTVIGLIYYPWRAIEKLFRRSLGATSKSHYYIMLFFRFFFKTFPVIISFGNGLIKTPQTVKLRVDLCQNNQQWFFRLRGKYEIEWITLVAKGMESADSFIDIGSNIGLYAITISQAFPSKRVIAVEPLNENFLSLNENIKLNSLSNIKAIRAAVSNQEGGKTYFYPNPIHDGGGSVIKSPVYRTGDISIDAERFQKKNPKFCKEAEIKNIKLDEMIESHSVIKIDVEGAEVSVLESGKKSFQKGLIDMVVIEVLDETVDAVITLFDDLGFDCFALDYSHPLKVSDRLKWFVGNIYCLRRGSQLYGSLKGEI